MYDAIKSNTMINVRVQRFSEATKQEHFRLEKRQSEKRESIIVQCHQNQHNEHFVRTQSIINLLCAVETKLNDERWCGKSSGNWLIKRNLSFKGRKAIHAIVSCA